MKSSKDSSKFKAIAKYIPYSPYKLRGIADVIRGKNAEFALHWLATHATQRTKPLAKVLKSAVANAENLANLKPNELIVKDFRVDQGPIFRYFKPGAMGRASMLRRRFCHISVTVENKAKKV